MFHWEQRDTADGPQTDTNQPGHLLHAGLHAAPEHHTHQLLLHCPARRIPGEGLGNCRILPASLHCTFPVSNLQET